MYAEDERTLDMMKDIVFMSEGMTEIRKGKQRVANEGEEG